ncbi:hypothetical protein J715_3960 [Acinetobacter baumannii 1571545]|nr:hypothetical protein J715_3960 [Acinetobacter baumannii 1571545]
MWSYKLGPSKPTGNVGQPAKDSIQVTYSQAYKMTFALK